MSTKPLAGFPRRGNAFAILSTGCASFADKPNSNGDTGCKDNGLLIRGARDVTVLRVRLDVPKAANCLSFRFRFLSEEFPEYVGSDFNDAFIAELDRPGWNTPSQNDPRISAPDSFARTVDGKLISVNATGIARVSKANAKGTTYDAATRVLRASTPVKPGRHYLYLSIFDQGDRIYDSAVFMDQLTVNSRTPCKAGLAVTQ